MRKMGFMAVAAGLLFGTACSNVEELADVIPAKAASKEVQYTIAAGSHHAVNRYQSISKKELRFKVRFDSSAIYTTADPTNQADINKLFGFSDCGTHHHTNSARFGWRWFEEKLELWAYTYEKGERMSELISEIDLNKTYEASIRATDTAYLFELNDTVKELSRACSGQPEGYLLYPYFGGDEVAPQDIRIWIEEM
jgi:hypothetical protein